MCIINKSAHTKNSGNLFNDPCIKLFVKKGKELGPLIQALRIYSDDIGMEFGYRKMCYANNEKRETTNNERNRTTKSRKKLERSKNMKPTNT